MDLCEYEDGSGYEARFTQCGICTMMKGLRPKIITGHTGWTDDLEFAFAHKDKLCSPFKKRVPDPTAPYDAYDESDDTEEKAKTEKLKGVRHLHG